jgi:hypothetical protein
MSSVTLSTSLTSIPDNTFRECTSLSTIDIPGSVSSIGSSAFYGCAALTSINIPASVASVSLDAFRGCGNLTNISVSAGSSYYSSAGGCLYNAAMTRLLLVPEGKTSVSIAAGTQTIGSGAMQDCTGISTLSIPSGVTTIEGNAFSGSGITSITIPATVTSIGSQGSWAPGVIYGVAGSYAQTYAMNNSIPFYTGSAADYEEENGDDANGGGDNQNPGNAQDGTVVGTDGTQVDANGNVVDANGNIVVAAGTATTNGQGTGDGTHTLDETPTTADGIDPRYFLCLAIFACGIGVILYSRFAKLQYVSNQKNR